MREKWKLFWKAFIPKKISNSLIVAVMRAGAALSFVSKTKEEHHKSQNKQMVQEQIQNLFAGRYIEKQQMWKTVFFGNGKANTIAHSGCGIIATYNALVFLEQWEEPKIYNLIEMIGYYEKNGAVLGGRFGIVPNEIEKCMRRLGYAVKSFPVKRKTTVEEINAIGTVYPAAIVTFFNNENDITYKMHTVCITKENGRFFAHNSLHFKNKAPEGAKTFFEAVQASAFAPKLIYIMGVTKSENNAIKG